MSNKNEEKLEAKILNEIRMSDNNITLENLIKIFPENKNKINKVLDKLITKGIVEEIDGNNGIKSFILRKTDKPLNKQTIVIKKIKREINKLKKTITSFIPHIVSFFSVITGLIIINLLTSPGYFWFIWVIGGWGIGLLIHFAASIIAGKQKKSLENLSDNTTYEQFKIFQNILKNEEGLFTHTASYLIINTFIFCIYWFVAHTVHPWFIYPIIGWGTGLAIHIATHIPIIIKLKKKLKLTGFDFNNIKESKTNSKSEENVDKIIKNNNDNYKNIINEALKLKDLIISNIKSNEKIKNKIDSGIEEIIDNHINKIKELTLRDKKISSAIASISINEIDKQIDQLENKINLTDNKKLKKEYNKTIEKYRVQIKTYNELKEKKELYYLRISNSLINLKQLNLEILNMKELLDDEESLSYNSLEEQAYELSNHVKNLKESYSSLNRELE